MNALENLQEHQRDAITKANALLFAAGLPTVNDLLHQIEDYTLETGASNALVVSGVYRESMEITNSLFITRLCAVNLLSRFELDYQDDV